MAVSPAVAAFYCLYSLKMTIPSFFSSDRWRSVRLLVALVAMACGSLLFALVIEGMIFYRDFAALGAVSVVSLLAALALFSVPFASVLLCLVGLVFVLWNPVFRSVVFNINTFVLGLGPFAVLAYLSNVFSRSKVKFHMGMNCGAVFFLISFVVIGIHTHVFFDGGALYPYKALFTHEFISDLSIYRAMMWSFGMVSLPLALFSAWFLYDRYQDLSSNDKKRALLLALGVGCAYVLYMGYRYYIARDLSSPFWRFYRLAAPRTDPNMLGFRLGILALFFFALVPSAARAEVRALIRRPFFWTAVIFVFLVGLTLSRATVLGLILGIGVVVIRRRFQKSAVILLLATLIALGTSIGTSSVVFKNNYFARFIHYTPGKQADSYRPEYSHPMKFMWALSSLPEYVWTGFGPAWRKHYIDGVEKRFGKTAEEYRIYNLNNLFIDYAVFGGIFLFLPLLALVLWPLRRGWFECDDFKQRLGLSVGTFVVIHSLFNVALESPINMLIFFFVLAWL